MSEEGVPGFGRGVLQKVPEFLQLPRWRTLVPGHGLTEAIKPLPERGLQKDVLRDGLGVFRLPLTRTKRDNDSGVVRYLAIEDEGGGVERTNLDIDLTQLPP